MAKKIYLLSGHTSTGRLKTIDKRILDTSDNKNVLILNLTFPDKEQLRSKIEFFQNYFRKLGADNVESLSEENPDIDVEEAFKEAGVLYLPGGDTKTFIQKIREKNLESRISSFEGVISGNSAGAYVLCPEYLKIRGDKIEIIPTMGLVNFWVKSHYESKFDSALTELSKGREIYALQDESAIGYDTELEFVGDIWKFSEGRKQKVN